MNDRIVYEKLAGLINRPEWDNFLVYVTNLHVECHNRLETCNVDNLKGIQGELKILKDILTLRNDVNKIMSER